MNKLVDSFYEMHEDQMDMMELGIGPQDVKKLHPISEWEHQSPDGSNSLWSETLYTNDDMSVYVISGQTYTDDPSSAYSFAASPIDMRIYLIVRTLLDMEGSNFQRSEKY